MYQMSLIEQLYSLTHLCVAMNGGYMAKLSLLPPFPTTHTKQANSISFICYLSVEHTTFTTRQFSYYGL